MSEMFLYTVKPRKTIIGLSGSTKVIRTNKSVYLTKEDVYLCLKSAIVYRRFANEGFNERVTIDDVERVHREHYISPEDWIKLQANEKSAGTGTVVVPNIEKEESTKVEDHVVETLIKNESKQSKDFSVKEEIEEDTVIVEEDNSTVTDEKSLDVEDEEDIESDDDIEIEKINSEEE